MLWGQSESGSPADEGTEMAEAKEVEEVVEYEADDIRFRVDSGLGYLTGHAKVVRGTGMSSRSTSKRVLHARAYTNLISMPMVCRRNSNRKSTI